MSKYITHEPVTITKIVCSHPKVKKIWEYGGFAGLPSTKEATRTIAIILDDESIVEFTDSADGQAEQDAEDYLAKL